MSKLEYQPNETRMIRDILIRALQDLRIYRSVYVAQGSEWEHRLRVTDRQGSKLIIDVKLYNVTNEAEEM